MNVLHEHVAAGTSKPGAGVQTRRIGSNMRRRRRDLAVPCGALRWLAVQEAARGGAPDAPGETATVSLPSLLARASRLTTDVFCGTVRTPLPDRAGPAKLPSQRDKLLTVTDGG